MNEIRRIAWFLLGVVLVAVPLLASAGQATYQNQGSLSNTTQSDFGRLITGRDYVPVQGGGVDVNSNVRTTVAAGRVPVVVNNALRERVLAQGVGRLAVGAMRGSIQGLVLGTAIDAAMQAAGYECDLTGCRQALVAENCPGGICSQAATAVPAGAVKTYRDDVWIGHSTAQAACSRAAWNTGVWCNSTAMQGQVMSTGLSTFSCRKYNACGYNQTQDLDITHSCPQGGTVTLSGGTYICQGGPTGYQCPSGQGWTLSGSQCTRPQCAAGLNRNPANGQCGAPGAVSEDVVASTLGTSLPGSEQADLVEQADQKSIPVEAEQPVVTGPATVTSSPTTTTTTVNNQTTTTTNTTVVNNTYNNNTWNYSVVNKSETRDAQGALVESKEDQVDDSVSVSDTALGDVPKLYDRKYPDGMQGVWNTQKANLTAGGLAGLQSVFVPNISGGQCPTWTINANIGPHMNFGSGTISPPCWIWDAIKVIFVITALFLARRLIFGG